MKTPNDFYIFLGEVYKNYVYKKCFSYNDIMKFIKKIHYFYDCENLEACKVITLIYFYMFNMIKFEDIDKIVKLRKEMSHVRW